MKRGPAPNSPEVLIDDVTLHTKDSRFGKGGEFRGRDIKQLIGVAVLGTTKYDNTFKIDSAWKKLWTQHPEQLQAGTKVPMEEARSKWTTKNNFEQCFNDAKVNLIKLGLVIDREVRDTGGNCFRK